MAKQFYKLDEYPDELPSPKQFPTRDASIIAIEDYPNTFTDGFMTDLSVKEEDKQRLEKLVVRTASKPIFDGILEVTTRKTTILLSMPQYIYTGFVFIAYVLTAPDIEPVGIQVKYYRYFRNRYPGCGFYASDDKFGVKSVKLDNKIVGLWMALILPRIEGV